jgi:putative methylase
MKKRDLEMRLQSLSGFVSPDAFLEQYSTPAVIASDILFTAYAENDIAGKKVNDLGCGTGIFAIGAAMLGADAEGFDLSASAIDIARQNASAVSSDAIFSVCDVSEVTREASTTLMNPPFGSQNKHADRPFLEKAMELTRTTYSVHMECTLPFIEKCVNDTGKEICFHRTYKYHIPHTFSFHSRTERTVSIVMVMIK